MTAKQSVSIILRLWGALWALGAITLLLAGVYQFTPLKYHCLEKCRSPFSFITQHWRGRDAAGHILHHRRAGSYQRDIWRRRHHRR